jgi:hypothetical protein
MPASQPPSLGNPPDGRPDGLADPVGSAVGLAGDGGAAEIPAVACPDQKPVGRLATLALAGISISTMLIILISFLGPSAAEPPMPFASAGPLFFASARPGQYLVAGVLWLAVAVGAAGVAAGLVAVRRGWRPRPRALVAVSLLGVILLMLVPPIGSTDLVDDAIYGRIAALGHSPYVFTARQLKRTEDPVASFAPRKWRRIASPYGPLITVTQAAASKLAGDSASRTMFWLKVWNALAFLAVALALDRFFRSDAARRARAHLLWTVNPLMLLAVMAGGHNDVLGVVCGLLGVLALRRLNLTNGLVAGLLIGLAIAAKAPFLIFAVGMAIAALRSPRALAGLGIGVVAVVVPGYALAGSHAISSVVKESGRAFSLDEPMRLLANLVPYGERVSLTQALAFLATLVLAAVLLWRLPAGPLSLPAVRPVLALMLAWLVFSPLQRAWYDVLLFPLLALMPATRLDWIVLGRAFLGAVGQLPGNIIQNKDSPHGLLLIEHFLYFALVPVAFFGIAGLLAWMCVNGKLVWSAGGAPRQLVPH